ncbi:MAG: DUF2179 domain-containing protein [Bacteroidales bacterium]|jgi:uncharacterized protein YebE (UPF0316 family)|nr:DUF2179 domain-containing protein [Bacteroidales bacterium]
MDIDFSTYIIGPLLIFTARMCDVTLGTTRIIFVSRGYKNVAPIIGFFEILIWLFAITYVMNNLTNWVNYIAYAAGFAMGNYVGIKIEEKIALGNELVRIIAKDNTTHIIQELREKGYGTTVIDAQGKYGKVAVIYVIVDRKRLDNVINIIKIHNPKAFYTVEDIRFVNRDVNMWIPKKDHSFSKRK